jgi:adenine-specific DNA methylase
LDLHPDKLRGGYYTSRAIAAWLTEWAIRKPDETVLEPSCGNGIFLETAIARLWALGATSSIIGRNVRGVEILPVEADAARRRVYAQTGLTGRNVVATGDFFAWFNTSGRQCFDVLIGNPPFIRYQTFPEPYRSLAMAMMVDVGMAPNRLTNIWVPFVVAATVSLRPGGRLAMVLPAELLQVTYAAQLRSFLIDHFAHLNIVACNELFFVDAEQEVVLLLGERAMAKTSGRPRCAVTLTETKTASDLTRRKAATVVAKSQPKLVQHDSEKWLKFFLSRREIGFMRALRGSAETTTLKTHASVDVGVVTGKNEFFVLNAEQVAFYGLSDFVSPLLSRAAQLPGARVTAADWRTLAAKGDRIYLLNVGGSDAARVSARLAKYVRFGESKGFDQGYKCSIRTPWYAVPSVWVPDGFLFRQIYNFPRAVANRANATSTDTIHRLRCVSKPERVIANTYTYLSAASAEIEGRSYGGGVLELEPTEAERLMMPTLLGAALPLAECDKLVRSGRLVDVLGENDALVLRGTMGLSRPECQMLQDIWVRMRDRRGSRRRTRIATDTGSDAER